MIDPDNFQFPNLSLPRADNEAVFSGQFVPLNPDLLEIPSDFAAQTRRMTREIMQHSVVEIEGEEICFGTVEGLERLQELFALALNRAKLNKVLARSKSD